jgi:hypothetical protein
MEGWRGTNCNEVPPAWPAAEDVAITQTDPVPPAPLDDSGLKEGADE